MSTFACIAIVLTVVYIIYYTVMIMNDIYGKKSVEREKIEEIDVPSAEDDAIPDESPIEVVESDYGFVVGGGTAAASTNDDERQLTEESSEHESNDESQQVAADEKIRKRLAAVSESIEPHWDNAMYKEDFMKSLSNDGKDPFGRSLIKVNPVHDKI